MPEVVRNLLLIYAGVVLLNTVISFALWWKLRDSLTRSQLLIWAAAVVVLVAQGILSQNPAQVIFATAFVFLVTIAIANLLATVFHVRARWRLYFSFMLAGLVLTAVAMYQNAPFMVVSLPVVSGAAFPILSTAFEIAFRRWKESTTTGKGLILASLFYGLHIVDFAYFGNKPQSLTLMFSLAVMSIFALSVFVPAVVVETTTEKHARTAAEMEAARRIQLNLLPQKPEIDGFELSCYMQPAEEVGGDYYDILNVGDRSWIVLGDVTDHGLSSGLVMLMAQSIISSILHTRDNVSPSELNALTNGILFNNLTRLQEERTMTIVSICIKEGNQVALSGSHDDVYIHRHKTNEVEVISVMDFPIGLGFMDTIEVEDTAESKHELEPGDTMFIITDGVTEAALKGDHLKGTFSEEGLIDFIKTTSGKPLDDIRDGLVARLDDYTGGVFHDDVTFVLARRKEATAAA